jgi:hypothetical protein
MDQTVLNNQKKNSNISVTEEVKKLTGIWGTESESRQDYKNPGERSGFLKIILDNSLPLLKAVVIITLFLLNGVGFSPLGCKTQYLMSSKFWYNKQMVVFFIIYFIINLGGYTISKLTNPVKQLILSIACLLLYNIVGRLGEVWFSKNPYFYPGPITYFGLVAFPLVTLYIIDDMRRYLIAEHSLIKKKNNIDALRITEMVLISIIALITIVGFWKAFNLSKIAHGKNFIFISFFFGAPMALIGKSKNKFSDHCTNAIFHKFKKDIGSNKVIDSSKSLTPLVGIWTFIIALIGGSIALFNKSELWKRWRHLKNSYRNKLELETL